MNNNYTHISILLDKSGSMEQIRTDTIGGFNAFMAQQRKAPGKATVSLSLFDSTYNKPLVMSDISNAKDLDEKSYVPGGSTALFGGIGRLIDETGHALELLPEQERPAKVVFLIITDGEENNTPMNEWSRKYTLDAVNAAIKQQKDIYQWEFVFIGTNEQSIMNAAQLGVSQHNVLFAAANAEGTQALYEDAAANVRMYRAGAKMNMSWDKAQVDKQDKAKGKGKK